MTLGPGKARRLSADRFGVRRDVCPAAPRSLNSEQSPRLSYRPNAVRFGGLAVLSWYLTPTAGGRRARRGGAGCGRSREQCCGIMGEAGILPGSTP